MRITRRLEFDAGHRIQNHDSQCRHLHGHRYAIEVTVSGELVAAEGAADQAMVLDFGNLKEIMHRIIVADWDHAFLAHAGDRQVLDFLATIPDHRTVVFPQPPTAEYLARVAFGRIGEALLGAYGARVTLEKVRIYETPNCWAEAP
jgi:6-pyruvoyltetrahydropterin/6-carboxytetrahydropterin synthase